MPKQEAKKPVGRPRFEITEDVIKEAQQLASEGVTEAQIAIKLGIAQSTYQEKKNEYPELSAAIKKGKAEAVSRVENAFYKRALSCVSDAATIFYLKAQAGWKDKEPDTIINNNYEQKIIGGLEEGKL